MKQSGKRVAWIVLALVLAVSGCSGSDSISDANRIVREYENGPVRVTLELSDAEITVADRVEMRLEVVAPEGHDVTLPGPEADFGQFSLVDFGASEPEPVGEDQIRYEEFYLLEPFLSGEYAMGPFTVGAVSGGAADIEIATDEIHVLVTSILPPGDEIPEIHDIAPLAELPPSLWRWIGLSAAALFVAGLLVLAARRLLRRAEPSGPIHGPPVPLAHQIAWAELDRLLNDRLIECGQIDPFYTRLTGILRRYIERRFGVRAPVQTTEQFLAAIRHDATFDDSRRATLDEFLRHGDLVKFAGDRPPAEVIDGSFALCKRFVDETREGSASTDEAGLGGTP